MTHAMSRRLKSLSLCAAICCAFAGRTAVRPQTPPPPATDTFFAGVEKFETGATSVTRVESDHNRDRRHDSETQADPAEPRRLSTVYVFGYDKPGLYNPVDVEFFRRKLHTTEWTCRDCVGRLKPGETVDACTRPSGASSLESVVIEMRLQKLTFVHTIGRHGSDSHQSLDCHED